LIDSAIGTEPMMMFDAMLPLFPYWSRIVAIAVYVPRPITGTPLKVDPFHEALFSGHTSE